MPRYEQQTARPQTLCPDLPDLVEHGIEYRHVLALCWPNARSLLISMRLSISWVE